MRVRSFVSSTQMVRRVPKGAVLTLGDDSQLNTKFLKRQSAFSLR